MPAVVALKANVPLVTVVFLIVSVAPSAVSVTNEDPIVRVPLINAADPLAAVVYAFVEVALSVRFPYVRPDMEIAVDEF